MENENKAVNLEKEEYTNSVEFNGNTYIVLGKTADSNVMADVGDTVSIMTNSLVLSNDYLMWDKAMIVKSCAENTNPHNVQRVVRAAEMYADVLQKGEDGVLMKTRVYLKPGQKVPEGVTVQTSPRGKKFYETRHSLKTKISDEEKNMRDWLRRIEQEAKRQNELDHEQGPKMTPWQVTQKVNIEMLGDNVTRYTRGGTVVDVTNTGVDFTVRINGKLVGHTPKERDATEYVRKVFEGEKK